jgi:hypothetical protein
MFMVDKAMDTVRDLRNDAPFDDDSVSWNRREYRYFNPSDNYKGEPAEDIRKYVRQDYERMEAYNRGTGAMLACMRPPKLNCPHKSTKVVGT